MPKRNANQSVVTGALFIAAAGIFAVAIFIYQPPVCSAATQSIYFGQVLKLAGC